MLHLFDTSLKQPVLVMNNSGHDYLVDVKLGNGVILKVSQNDLESNMRSGRYVMLG